ncbi:MAG: hypothetical protein RIS54_1925 [Verrucomicrobiota bacterium]|jgi:oxygen-dependent protoporphyrinogen oxidase
MISPAPSIAILGAGITGLTAAHRLAAQGQRVTVFEQADHAGGVIGSEAVDGWLIERGPNSLLANEPALAALIDELNLSDEVRPANPAARKRFLVRDGRPIAAPMSPLGLLSTPLFSFRAKCRLLGELFQKPRQRESDVSLAKLIADHFGPEFVDYALNPFVSGVYAGDPNQLSAQYAFPALWRHEQTRGSMIRGFIADAKARRARGEARGGIISFRHGLQTLTDALARALPTDALRLNTTVEAIAPGYRWTVCTRANGETHSESFDRVIATLPAGTLAELRVGADDARPLSGLSEILFPPVSALFLGYRRDQIAHPLDGFGLLVPAVEKLSVLGVLFSSTLFPRRAPEGHVALTVMVGGTRQPELAALPPDELLARIQPDLAALLGVRGAPVFQRHQHWPRAIPQYTLGHDRHLAAIAECEAQFTGLFIGGQCRDGIAVPACIAAGEKLAARALGSDRA